MQGFPSLHVEAGTGKYLQPTIGSHESTVQGLLSLQELAIEEYTQPVSGLHESAVHALLSLHVFVTMEHPPVD